MCALHGGNAGVEWCVENTNTPTVVEWKCHVVNRGVSGVELMCVAGAFLLL